MSNLQGSYTNNDTYNQRPTSSGGGMVIAQTCIICGVKHGSKSSPKCSRAKQAYYKKLRDES